MNEMNWPHAATLVLAAETPRQRSWAANAAISLARELAERWQKVVLTDLQVRRNSLAEVLGVEEGPGIVDVLFRGASFSAVARKPQSQSFYFLSLGTAPPPRQVLFRHPRWTKIASRLPESNAYLLACVSAEDWLEVGPIPGFEACIVFNAAGLEVDLPSRARRAAEFLAPPEIREEWGTAAGLTTATPTEPGDSSTAPPPIDAASLGLAERSADLHPAMTPELAANSPPMPAAPPAAAGQGKVGQRESRARLTPSAPRKRPITSIKPKRRRRVVPVAVLAAAALLVLLWSSFRSEHIPNDAGRLEAAANEEAVKAPLVRPAEPAEEAQPGEAKQAEVDLGFSVAIASYSSFDDALARQRERTRSTAPFYVAPTVVSGVVYYRVFAGMLPERGDAEDLLRQLVQEGVKDTMMSWDIRPTLLAFAFGVYPSLGEAEAAVDLLLGQGIPAYIVTGRDPAAANEVGYRVYAGGYETPDDARALREQIERAGMNPQLVTRAGLVLP